MNALQQLIDISRYYGDDPAYVVAGGGNTSVKEQDRIWVKASGIPLAGIGKDGFVCLSRKKLGEMEQKAYSGDPAVREEQVKNDIRKAVMPPAHLRPSVETSLHNLIGYTFVVHTHPTLVNGVLCARRAREEIGERFGNEALFVEYIDPGFTLFKRMQEQIRVYRERYGVDPRIIFLQNHGVFVAADTTEEIRQLYREIGERIGRGRELSIPSPEPVPFESGTGRAVREFYAGRGVVTGQFRSRLLDHFTGSLEEYMKVSGPFTPDIIVYCKSDYLFLGRGLPAGRVADACMEFEETHGYFPRAILEEGGGLIAVEEDPASVERVVAVFTELMKISYLSEQFGGPRFMTGDQIRFIDSWEVENYRRKMARGK